MEFTQFISYLDYGVLGLSAIILILSFVLLSREQQREIFRPEVAKAIRRYMMLALGFAAVSLVSTIVDGVMVQPSKEEKKIQEEGLDALTNALANDMSERLKKIDLLDINNVNEINVPSENSSENQPKTEIVENTIPEKPNENTVPEKADTELTEEEKLDKVSEAIIAPYYDFGIDSSAMEKSINIVGKKSKVVREHKRELLDGYIKKAKKRGARKE